MSSISPQKRHHVIEITVFVSSLVSLAVAAALAIWLVRIYPRHVADRLKLVEVTIWPWGLLPAVATGALCFRRARAVGYSLGTLVLVGLAAICFLFWQQWPDQQVSLFGWEIMTGTAFLIAVTLGIVWAGGQIWDRWNCLAGVDTAHGAIAEAERKLEAAESSAAYQATAITALKNTHDGLTAQIKEIEEARESEARVAAAREEQRTKRRLYEAQYVGGFLVAVGFRVAQVRQAHPISINYLQGGRDAELADLVSATGGRFWLIEFKRSEAELKDEFTKRTRERQINELVKDSGLIALADRCHFIGWGVQHGNVPKLSLSRYLDLWREPKQFSPSGLKQVEAFLEAAIPNHNEVATVGVPASEFQRYLRTLEFWGGSATGDDDFAALVMYQDERGNLRFFTEPSFGSFMEGVKNAHKIAEEHARRLRMERDNKGPSHRSGLWRSF
jgi:hypothetical protein